MRLGVVMAGHGATAAVAVGVLQVLYDRGLEPCCVCGLQGGAWPAALYIAGSQTWRDAPAQAQRMGRRILRVQGSIQAMLRQKRTALADARRLEHLLLAQAGHRMLCICPGHGVILCRMAQTGRKVLFSSRPCDTESGALVSMQATVSFAARAAMTIPPFLNPMEWMGEHLIADDDVDFASRQLLAMGAQRVLVIKPMLSVRRVPDAMDLVGFMYGAFEGLPAQAAMLSVTLPPYIGALSVDRLEEMVSIGRLTAQSQLDDVLSRLGMAQCRVLPFKRRCDTVSV